jgi:aarF domain-containing kinase
MLRRFVTLKTAAVLGLGGAGVAGTTYALGDEGTKRSMVFWANIFPVYAHYRVYQLLDRDLGIISSDYADAQYEKLHEKYTDKIKEITYNMRGFYLKNAQVLSTQDDFVPPAYMKWVKDTQDNVPSEFTGTGAREHVAKMMMEEQGLEFDDIFSAWQDEPLGVASIGQVHKAVLKKTGEVVAVKILVPGIEARFRSDIHTLKQFCQLSMPQHVTAFDEIEKQFCSGQVFVAMWLCLVLVGVVLLC